MANVEVQLDITADYKAALMAIANLGKALDEVQARAKLVAPAAAGGAGGGQNGGQDSGEQNKVLEERKAAMAALGESMKAAAAAAAELSDAIGKLSPALAEMGPQDEQVQRVTVLAGHYKELATAMGIAAEAAAKYNSSGAQQGEIDDRVRKLAEENQALLEKIAAMREEFDALKQMTKELQQNRAERAAAAKAAKEEMEVEKDLSYEMQLAAMTKQQLTEEIKRLTEERKKAAAAGEKEQATYEARTAELQLARKALTKLRQEESLMRIMWAQQASAARQMGESVKTIADGVMNFSENAKNGTLNLSGMVSAVIEFSSALKSGLDPLGWVLLAVEGLTSAWNYYAEQQKAAEEAQKKRMQQEVEYMQKMYEAYERAAEAAKRFNEQEARKESLEAYIEQFKELNNALKERNELEATNLRMAEAAAALQAKEEEQQLVLERGRIMRAFWEGAITEEERDAQLDRLSVTRARQRQAQVMAGLGREVGRRQGMLTTARENANYAQLQLNALDGSRMLSPEEMTKRAEAFANAMTSFYDITRTIDELGPELQKLEEQYKVIGHTDTAAARQLEQLIRERREDYERAQRRLPEIESRYRTREDELMGWTTEQIRSGEYAQTFNEWKAKRDEAERRVNAANEELERSTRELAEAQRRQAEQLDATTQAVRHAEQNVAENATNRAAQRAYNERRAAEAQAQREREAREREAARRGELYAEGRRYAQVLGPEESQTLRWVMGDATQAVQSGRVSNRTAQRLLNALEEFKNTRSDVDDNIAELLLRQIKDITTIDRRLQRQIADML